MNEPTYPRVVGVVVEEKCDVVERVSTRVVVVVVRERFSLVMSAIWVWIRGHRSEVTRLVYHMAQVFVYCCILTTGFVGPISTLFCCVNIKLVLFFVD